MASWARVGRGASGGATRYLRIYGLLRAGSRGSGTGSAAATGSAPAATGHWPTGVRPGG
ncbi:hypothetical protein [Kibdelosporangium philippinense]|uniref:hypothetical protein n=1 Tax=Kibdelosporangium philippinense TaxID=211113 RepID=UPI0036132B52